MSKFKLELMIFLVLLISIQGVFAANIGVSPASLEFRNVLRGGYSEEIIVISADADRPVFVELIPRGEIVDWLDLSVWNFTVSKNEPYFLKVSINPPDDIPNGNYTGFLRIMTGELGEGVKGNAVGIIRSSLDLSINADVTDIEVTDCISNSFNVNSVEEGDDIVFTMDVVNNGNVRLRPRVTIDIWDENQISIVKNEEFRGKVILPTTKDKLSFRVDSEGLGIGQYWADVSVIECYDSKTLTFDILKPGALRAEGALLGIVTRREAEIGQTVPIEINFKNTGEKEVDAQFKGRVTLGDKIIQILETERLNVPISETEKFNLFFTPQEEGKHIISGRVFYSGKRTFESSAVLNVISKQFKWGAIIAPIIYVLLIFVIAILFFRIRKERRAYINKIRGLK